MTTDPDRPPGINLAVIAGPISSALAPGTGTRGATRYAFAVRAPRLGQHDNATSATSVPVEIADPPAWLLAAEPGEVVAVVGELRRRFYQRAHGVASRVAVEAVHVVRATADDLADQADAGHRVACAALGLVAGD